MVAVQLLEGIPLELFHICHIIAMINAMLIYTQHSKHALGVLHVPILKSYIPQRHCLEFESRSQFLCCIHFSLSSPLLSAPFLSYSVI